MCPVFYVTRILHQCEASRHGQAEHRHWVAEMLPKQYYFIYSEERECGCKGEEGEQGKYCLASARCEEGAGDAARRDPAAVEEAGEHQERLSAAGEFFSLLFTLSPSMSASRFNPIEGLKWGCPFSTSPAVAQGARFFVCVDALSAVTILSVCFDLIYSGTINKT